MPTSTSDEQLVSINENDKSYESVSSPSIYLSPNSSLIDIQNMAQEFDEINNHGKQLIDFFIIIRFHSSNLRIEREREKNRTLMDSI